MRKTVMKISSNEAAEWCTKKHYSKRRVSMIYCFGLYIDGILSGICSFGQPINWRYNGGFILFGSKIEICVFELSRLVANDGMDKNTLSWFVSQCYNHLPKRCALVSYADTAMGHHGYIYQALNWLYTGKTSKQSKHIDQNGKELHSKGQANRRKRGTEGGYIGSLKTVRTAEKHRYIYFLGSKTEKKKLRKKLVLETLPYPKGENLRYDSSYNPHTQMILQFQ